MQGNLPVVPGVPEETIRIIQSLSNKGKSSVQIANSYQLMDANITEDQVKNVLFQLEQSKILAARQQTAQLQPIVNPSLQPSPTKQMQSQTALSASTIPSAPSTQVQNAPAPSSQVQNAPQTTAGASATKTPQTWSNSSQANQSANTAAPAYSNTTNSSLPNTVNRN